MAISLPPMVLFATIPCACNLASLPSGFFRSTRYGANAPGQTTSIITTSNAEDFEEKFLASCEYDSSDFSGCGRTFTWMPVSFVNFFASARSRTWLPPTALSPTNVSFTPLNFALSFAALGTAGGAIAADCLATVGPALPTVAAASEAISASAPTSPAMARALRRFTSPRPFSIDPSTLAAEDLDSETRRTWRSSHGRVYPDRGYTEQP